jgi:hypothetical protein
MIAANDLDRLRHDPLMKLAVGRCPQSGEHTQPGDLGSILPPARQRRILSCVWHGHKRILSGPVAPFAAGGPGWLRGEQ